MPDESVSNSLCRREQSPYLLNLLERPCNTHPCLAFTWVPGPWAACPLEEAVINEADGSLSFVSGGSCQAIRDTMAFANPEPGMIYRNVTCMDSLGNAVAPRQCEPSLRPITAERSAWASAVDLCQMEEIADCAGNGVCSNGSCVCQPGFHGIGCQVGRVLGCLLVMSASERDSTRRPMEVWYNQHVASYGIAQC